jgi:non-specific serine/threonine protein kinase
MIGQARAENGVDRGEPGQTQAPVTITPAQLSRREREVALLIAQGLPNRQIGAALAIKERTVEDHVSRLLRKLQLTNRAQVILWAIANGLATMPAPAQESFDGEVGKM